MYRQEILEYLKPLADFKNNKNSGYETVRFIFNNLQYVQYVPEIYAGVYSSYSNIVDNKKLTTLKPEDFHLPYDCMLVSYRNKTGDTYYGNIYISKCAMYVRKFEDVIMFFSFVFSDLKQKWLLVPIVAKVDVGGIFMCQYDDVEKDTSMLDIDTVKQVGIEVFVTHAILDVLSCKNVNLTPVDPPEKLNKKRIKNGKNPLYRYHVLTVDLDKGRKQSSVGRGANLGTMPVHLCRGHFKEYTDEKPLFGRVTGRFWWQPYARGKAENGVVMKDYEIKKSNV